MRQLRLRRLVEVAAKLCEGGNSELGESAERPATCRIALT